MPSSNSSAWRRRSGSLNARGSRLIWDGGFPRPPLGRPRPAASLRSLRAALENASRFLSSAPLRVRIPLRWAHTKTVPFRGPFPIRWWAMRDVRVRLAPPAPRFVAPLLACCAGKRLRVSSAPHPGGFESLCTGPKKERPPSLGAFSIKWWAMRDSNPQPCACKAPALTVAPIARRD